MASRNLSIEVKIKRVEEIAQKVSDSSVTLDESLKLLKEANTLITDIEKNIEEAKEKLEKLK